MKSENLPLEAKNRRQEAVLFLILVAFVFLIYGNSIRNGYAMDDEYVTVVAPGQGNAKVEKGINGLGQIFRSHYVDTRQQNFEYRPLVLATFAIEYQLFGSNPHVSHLISVLLYASTCLLLFSVLKIILKQYHFIFPFLATLLFIAHPIHTEVVCNIKSRDELLAFFFGMLSMYLYLESIFHTKKWQFILSSVISLFVALLCKRTAILFVAVIPITIYFFTEMKFKKLLVAAAFLFIAYSCYLAFKNVMVHDVKTERVFVFFENPLFFEQGFWKRIPAALCTSGYYLKLLVFPFPLSCYYGYNEVPIVSWPSSFAVISLLLHGTLGVFALMNFTKKNILAYGAIIYFIGLAPFLNLVAPAVGIIGERFIYIASMGFCIMAAYFLLKIFKTDLRDKNAKIKSLNPLFLSLCLFVLIGFSAKTISRNTKWKDKLTLYRNDVRNLKNSCNLHYIYANALYPEIFKAPEGERKNALIEETTFHFKEAARLMAEGTEKYPKDFTTLNNLGTIYVNVLNDAVTAQPLFAKVKAIKPSNNDGQYNFAYCYEKRNMPDSAIFYYEKMVDEKRNYPLAYVRLHELYLKKQDYLKAVETDKKAIAENPERIDFYVNLGNSYMMGKDTLNGLKYFEEAVLKAPSDTILLRQVKDVFRVTGNKPKAEDFERKLRELRK